MGLQGINKLIHVFGIALSLASSSDASFVKVPSVDVRQNGRTSALTECEELTLRKPQSLDRALRSNALFK